MSTKQKKLVYLIILITLIFAGCKEKGNPPIDSDLKSLIATRVTTAMTTYNVPGVTVGLWLKDHTPYIKSWGESNINNQESLSSEHTFRIGSFTNTFTAMTILKMADEGKINLTTTIQAYFPNLPGANNITVKQLLAMQSGLGDLTDSPTYTQKYYNNPTYVYTHDQIIQIIGALPVHFAPGARTEFCSSNYYLLGKIIQTIGSDTAENAISRYTLEPKLLLKTKLPTDTSIPGNYSHGYISGTNNALTDRVLMHPAFTWTSGAMTSTVGDLQDWLKVVYHGEMLTTATHNTQMEISNFNGSSNIGYGLGIVKWGTLFGHTGYIQGFNTSAWYSPAHDAYIVVMANRFNDDGEDTAVADLLVSDIMSEIYPDLAIRSTDRLPR